DLPRPLFEEAPSGRLLGSARLLGEPPLLANGGEPLLVLPPHPLEEFQGGRRREKGIEAVIRLHREELEEVLLRFFVAVGAIAIEVGEGDDAVGIDQILVGGEDVLRKEPCGEAKRLFILTVFKEILGSPEFLCRRGHRREGEGEEEKRKYEPHCWAISPQGRGSVRIRCPARTTTSP